MEYTPMIIGGCLSLIFTILSGIALHRVNKQSDRIDAFSVAITTLENTAVNEGHVRSIIKEELQPLNNALPELIRSVNEFHVFIAEERGYRAGQRARRKNDIRDASGE